jgi:hypothetical protein
VTEPWLNWLIGQPGSPRRWVLGWMVLPIVVSGVVLAAAGARADDSSWTMWFLFPYVFVVRRVRPRESMTLPRIREMAAGMRRVSVTRYGEERYRAEASATLELVRTEPDPQMRRSLVTQYGEERYRAEASATLELVGGEPDLQIRRELIGRYGTERYRGEISASIALIGTEPDQRVRRQLLERYGAVPFVQETGRVIDHDLDALGEPRRLWIAPRTSDTAIVMIEVVNSTPEPDGTRHHHWLRVPPSTTTCRAAVAWTFGLAPDAYAPMLET